MKDVGEIAWVVVFVATGLIGIGVLSGVLPIQGMNGRWVEWIGALGGWAGAAVAIPSLVILARQNATSRLQLKVASYPALRERLADLQLEMRELTKMMEAKKGLDQMQVLFTLASGPTVEDYQKAVHSASEGIAKWSNACESKTREISLSRPNASLGACRGAVVVALEATRKEARRLWSMVVIEFHLDGTVTEVSLEEARTITAQMEQLLELKAAVEAITVWLAELMDAASATQKQIDDLMGIH